MTSTTIFVKKYNKVTDLAIIFMIFFYIFVSLYTLNEI